MFDYQETSKDCLLYTCTVSAFAATCKTVTGPKFPSLSECQIEEPANCKSFRKSECIYKGAIDSIQAITDAETCQEFCQLLADCAYYAFTETNKTCDLHKEGEVICTSFLGPRLPTLLECQGISTTSTGTTTATTTPIATTTSEQSGSGLVILVVGGTDLKNVELFSPDGKCQHSLQNVTFSSQKPVLGVINDKMIACNMDLNSLVYGCWTLDPSISGTWTEIPEKSTVTHSAGNPGLVYNDKLYIVNSQQPEFYDPVSNTWSNWTAPPLLVYSFNCFVLWRDSFLLFDHVNRHIQVFNLVSQVWTIVESTTFPLSFRRPSCIVLPNEDILMTGSDSNSAAIYNVKTNNWTWISNTIHNRVGSSLVSLGNRVYIIGGGIASFTTQVEEFDWDKLSWSIADASLLNGSPLRSAVAVPANLFSHLPGGCDGVD